MEKYMHMHLWACVCNNDCVCVCVCVCVQSVVLWNQIKQSPRLTQEPHRWKQSKTNKKNPTMTKVIYSSHVLHIKTGHWAVKLTEIFTMIYMTDHSITEINQQRIRKLWCDQFVAECGDRIAQSVVCLGSLSCVMQHRGFDPALSFW